jgi:hypothetical protein
VGNLDFASQEAKGNWLTLGLLPRLRGRPAFLVNIADEWRGFSRKAKTGRGLPRNQA